MRTAIGKLSPPSPLSLPPLRYTGHFRNSCGASGVFDKIGELHRQYNQMVGNGLHL